MSTAYRIDSRDQQAIVQELRAKLRGYVPNWLPTSSSASEAILQIFGRYNQVLIERLNQAPDRNKLAFLEMLGVNLLPSQAGRAPVAFTPMLPGDARVPAHSRLGAKVPGRTDPLIFETETDIALASARLAEVEALWPGIDSFADHSSAVIGGQPFTLFTPLKPIPHEFYMAHETLFAIAGFATLEIRIELSSVGSESLPLVWEFWEGEMWRAFKPFKSTIEARSNDSLDGTKGFTRSGIIRLVAECADSKKRVVNGFESFWIRVRTEKPIADQPGRVWPRVDRVSARSVIAQPLWRFSFTKQESQATGKVAVRGSAFRQPNGKSELHGPNFSDIRTTLRSETAAEWDDLDAGKYHLLLTGPGFIPLDFTFDLPSSKGVELFFDQVIDKSGIEADAAYSEGQKLDLTKAFYPFPQQAQAGNCFYLRSDEAFSKPGAHISLVAQGVATPQGTLSGDRVILMAETWNGDRWQDVNASRWGLVNLFSLKMVNMLEFDLPAQLAKTKINDEEGYWLRVRITSGGFAISQPIKIDTSEINVIEYRPQPIEQLRIGYDYASPWEAPQVSLTHNYFQWQDRTDDARRQGAAFEPFTPVDDRTPTLYFGFDQSLPADLISLFLDIEEVPGEVRGPALRWEYWDDNDTAWLPLTVKEETQDLALPGMVSILWPGVPGPSPATVSKASGKEIQLTDPREALRFYVGDQLFIEQDGKGELLTVAASASGRLTTKTPLSQDYSNGQLSRAKLARFGTPRTWVRARLQEDGDPRAVRFNGIYMNAVWASQVQTFENEILGSSNGQLKQVQFMRNTPVLPGQGIEVRELEGPRARIELPLLIQDLEAHGMSEADVRTVTDRRTGEVSQVWVRWQERPNFFFSGPGDRHYVIERSRGRIGFGDNLHGRIPPISPDGIIAKYYRAGGGLISNVSAGAINQILAGVMAKSVTNPRPAEGGADGEVPEAVLDRGPLLVRNRVQALTLDDYEAIAREASPAIAVARALPATHPTGRHAPGWVKLVVMPHSHDPQPQPSFQLRRFVYNFVSARMPASIAGQLSVVGPHYVEVGAVAVVAPKSMESAALVLQEVTMTLQSFLNPLSGGPDGKGWPFGRDVYLSDVAAIVEAIAGVDYIATLELTLGGTPHGEVVQIPDDRIVVAGPLRVTFVGDES